MMNLKGWHAIVALLVVGAAVASAQTESVSKKEFNELKKQLDRVASENARIMGDNARIIRENRQIRDENSELRRRVDSGETAQSRLESNINGLVGDVEHGLAATSVESEANPVILTGKFRVRLGVTFDRDFGLDVTPEPATE